MNARALNLGWISLAAVGWTLFSCAGIARKPDSNRRTPAARDARTGDIQCSPTTAAPLFRNKSVFNLTIDSDFFKIRDPNEVPVPGKITYVQNGTLIELPTEVEVRGSSRRGRCDFKPIRVRLDKTRLGGTIFEGGDDKLKIVTHCLNSPAELAASNLRVLKEYAVYQALEALDEPSFRTRLARIRYRDASEQQLAEAYAVFLEPKEDLAQRCGATYYKEGDDVRAQFDAIPEYTVLDSRGHIALDFGQRLILNSEIFNHTPHNNTLLLSPQTGAPLAMAAYDFDHSALVRDGRYWPNWQPWNGTWGDYFATHQDRGRWTSNDETWLRHYLQNVVEVTGYKGPRVSVHDWQIAVHAYAVHALTRRDAVFASLTSIPDLPQNARSLIQQRYDEYFTALARILSEAATTR